MNDRVPPYVRRHLASHAAAGDVLESVLSAETLPWLDYDRLSEVVRLTQAPAHSPLWVLLGAWRSVKHRWSWDDPVANAAALDIALLTSGMVPPARHHRGYGWRPVWAEWLTGGTVVGSAEGSKPSAVFGTVAGKRVIFGARANELWVWEAATGNQLGEPIENVDDIEAVAAADEAVVCVSRGGLVRVWNAAVRREYVRVQLPGGSFRSVATGRYGNERLFVTAGGDGLVHVCSLSSGEPFGPPLASPATVRGVAMHDELVAAGDSDGTVMVWDVGSRSVVSQVNLGVEVNAVALGFDPDLGPLVAVGTSAPDVHVLRLEGSDELTRPGWDFELDDEVRTVALGIVAGETVLAAGSLRGEAWVGSPFSGSPVALPHPPVVTMVEFGEVDGRKLLATTCADGNTRLWDPIRPSGARVQVGVRVGSLTVLAHTDGLHVLGGLEDDVAHWTPDGGRRDFGLTLPPHQVANRKIAHVPGVHVCSGVLDQVPVLVTARNRTADLWQVDLDSDQATLLKRTVLEGSQYRPIHLFVGLGRALIGTDHRDRVIVTDAVTGEDWPLRTTWPENAERRGFLDAGDAIWYAVVSAGSIHLSDALSGEPVARPLKTQAMWPVVSIGRFADRHTLAVLWPDQVRLVDPLYGREVGPVVELPSSAYSVAWAGPRGAEILLTSHHATVRAWNPRTGRKLAELPFGTGITAMTTWTTADGEILVVVGGPGAVMTRLIPPPAPDLSQE